MIKKDMFAGGRKRTFEMAAVLRKKLTHGEEVLWEYLRTKPLNFKFRRQHVYAIWILDFYCHALQLVIEVDGSIHDVDEVKEPDAKRQKEIEACGLSFLRFTNNEVEHNLDNVKKDIESFILTKSYKEQNTHRPKSPL